MKTIDRLRAKVAAMSDEEKVAFVERLDAFLKAPCETCGFGQALLTEVEKDVKKETFLEASRILETRAMASSGEGRKELKAAATRMLELSK